MDMDNQHLGSAVEKTYNSILTLIREDAFSLGDRLPSEIDLCDEFQVGRGTIREASRLLQARGFLEVRPGKGTYIISKTGANRDELAKWFEVNEPKLKDILQVRMALEPMTVRLAILRSSIDELNELQRIHQCSKIAASAKDSLKLAECDEDFHAFITQCSKSQLLIEINKNLNNILKDFRGRTFLLDENIENFIPAHEKILTAFETKDPEQGEEYMRQHLAKVGQDLEKSKEVA